MLDTALAANVVYVSSALEAQVLQLLLGPEPGVDPRCGSGVWIQRVWIQGCGSRGVDPLGASCGGAQALCSQKLRDHDPPLPCIPRPRWH